MADPPYEVRFADQALKELKKLGASTARRLLDEIEKKLTVGPLAYGDPLGGELAGYYKLRSGVWRVAYFVEERRILVLVLAVGKRNRGKRDNFYDQLTADLLDARREVLTRKIEAEAVEREGAKTQPK